MPLYRVAITLLAEPEPDYLGLLDLIEAATPMEAVQEALKVKHDLAGHALLYAWVYPQTLDNGNWQTLRMVIHRRSAAVHCDFSPPTGLR